MFLLYFYTRKKNKLMLATSILNWFVLTLSQLLNRNMKQQLLFYLYYLQRLQFVHRMLWLLLASRLRSRRKCKLFCGTGFTPLTPVAQAHWYKASSRLLKLLLWELTAVVTLFAVAYPNPTTDKIVLSLGNVDLTALSYVLYDLSGRLVLNALVQGLKPKLPCKICLWEYTSWK
jgi:hypothetical protein